jgi:hypothetical protein
VPTNPHQLHTHNQGDQIGRIFANWAIVFFGIILKNSEIARISGLLVFHGKKLFAIFDKKMAWVTFMIIFSHTHRFTLHTIHFNSACSTLLFEKSYRPKDANQKWQI